MKGGADRLTHYFKNSEKLAHNRKEISFRFLGIGINLTVDDGIFSKSKPDDGSLYLVEEILKLNPTGSLYDFGSGYGLMSLLLKKFMPNLSVSGIEINARAVDCAQVSAKQLGLDVEFKVGSVLDDVEGQYDWIITNPPIRAGKEVVYGFFTTAKEHLTPQGQLVVVIRRQQGAQSAAKFLLTQFKSVERLALRKGYEIWIAKNPLTSTL